MITPIPSLGALRALRQTIQSRNPQNIVQVRHATLLRRPKRPYTFTQLITLSDGSSFVHRTTSPAPVYKSTKDIRNTPLWNPSSQKLLNIEEDEAGKLRSFRSKFGRGWDAEGSGEGQATDADGKTGEDHLIDLISGQRKEKSAKKKKSAPAAKKAEDKK